jgi:hypothetical protein
LYEVNPLTNEETNDDACDEI